MNEKDGSTLSTTHCHKGENHLLAASNEIPRSTSAESISCLANLPELPEGFVPDSMLTNGSQGGESLGDSFISLNFDSFDGRKCTPPTRQRVDSLGSGVILLAQQLISSTKSPLIQSAQSLTYASSSAATVEELNGKVESHKELG